MKVTVSKDDLVYVLKRLKKLSEQAAADKVAFKEVVALSVIGEELMISAGPGTAFVAIYLPAPEAKEGSCHVSFQLLDLVKASPDTELVLSFEKKLSITGKSGFKAHLTEATGARLPFESMNKYALAGASAHITLFSTDVQNLVDISKAFPVYTGSNKTRWVEINQVDGVLFGAVQPNELGGVDNFPLDGLGTQADVKYVLPTALLPYILTFAGERVRVGSLIAAPGNVLIDDPDNSSWWGLMSQISIPNQQGINVSQTS